MPRSSRWSSGGADFGRPLLSVEVTHEAPPDWEGMLGRAGPEASYFQTPRRAEAIFTLDSAEAWFFRVLDERHVPVAGALVEKHFFYDRVRSRRRSPLPFLACNHGPFLLDPACAEEAVDATLRALLRTGRRAGALWVEFRGFHPVGRYWADARVAERFARRGFSRGRWATLIVDLRPTEEEMWLGLKRSARKSVNRCRQLGVVVREVETYRDFKTWFWEPYVRSEAHFGRPTFDYPENYWHVVWPQTRFFVASGADGQTVGVLGLLLYEGVAREVASAICPEAYEAKIPAQDLLHWELLRVARQSGARHFDLAGVSPAPGSPKEAGIRRFKEKWGGEYREYHTFERNIVPWSRQAAQAMARLMHR